MREITPDWRGTMRMTPASIGSLQGKVTSRADLVKQLSQTPPGAHFTYGEPRVTIVDSNVALLATSYTGTMGTATFSGYMTITLIRTRAGWRFLAGQS